MLSIEGTEMETFRQVFSKVLANSLFTGGTAFYSSVRSEFANVSPAISATSEIFIEGAFMGIGDYGSRQKMEVSNSVFLEFGNYRSFSIIRFSEAANPA